MGVDSQTAETLKLLAVKVFQRPLILVVPGFWWFVIA